MMKFKELFYISEIRKPYRDYLSRMFPDMPPEVRHELGTNEIIPKIKQMAAGNQNGNDPRNTPTVNHIPTSATNQNTPQYNSPNDIINKNEKVKKYTNADWTEEEIIDLHMYKLHPLSQEKIKFFQFGFRSIPLKRHDQRMKDQEKLRQTTDVENMNAIITLQTPQGLELLEGWHRVFNYLLSGAPPKEANAIRNGILDAHNVDYSQWSPVKIKAFIGRPKKEVATAY